MYRSDNDRSIKAEEYNRHKHYSKNLQIINCNMACID